MAAPPTGKAPKPDGAVGVDSGQAAVPDTARFGTTTQHRGATVGNLVMWALLTGGITGGVWVSIVLLANHARLRREQRELGMEITARRDQLLQLEARLQLMEQQHAELHAELRRDTLVRDSRVLDG